MIPRIYHHYCFILVGSLLAQVSHCSSSSSQSNDKLLTQQESRRVYSPYSTRIPHPQQHQQLRQKPYYEYSNENDPRVDSSSPYAYSEGGNREQNVGFADHNNGPPKGFPTFEEIQAHFQETSASHSSPGTRRPHPEFERGPPSSYSYGHSRPQSGDSNRFSHNQELGRPSSPNYDYDFGGQREPQHLLVEGQDYDSNGNSNPEEQPLSSGSPSFEAPQDHHRRKRRSVAPKDDDIMLADGSDNENFWQPAPYILFDRYKNTGQESVEQHVIAPKSNNISFHDSNSEEQRFFPSFPSPYLGSLNPFGGGGLNSLSPARAPLFPGPAANRAPSRYHPSTPFKFASAPNRGPSSAASHGHDRYREHDNNLLGSGNFEVVRGGTYYGEDDEGPSYHHSASPYRDEEDAYYAQNNGHSSPYRGSGGDFFANFRDFADINPHSRSYSHHSESRVKPANHNIYDKLRSNKYTEDADAERLETASSGDNHKPQFSMEYDPMMATF